MALTEKALRRFWKYIQPEPMSGCWLWTGGFARKSYGVFALSHGVMKQAHRIAYEEAHGPIPAGFYVCHRCDVPSCVNPDHLFLGTQRENLHDAYLKGRFGKLSEEDVLRVRFAPRRYGGLAQVARTLGISYSYAQQIRCSARRPTAGLEITSDGGHDDPA